MKMTYEDNAARVADRLTLDPDTVLLALTLEELEVIKKGLSLYSVAAQVLLTGKAWQEEQDFTARIIEKFMEVA